MEDDYFIELERIGEAVVRVYFKYHPSIGVEGIRIPNALTKFQTAYCRM
jgi:hypothetical protein